MKETPQLKKVLFYQAVGFLTLILISWLMEATDLRALILGQHPYISDYSESAFEMLFVFVVWLLVAGSTRRLLGQVRYLQGFMRVCAWCRRINCKDQWMRLEQFMHERFDTRATHGICPDCLRKEEAALEQAQQKQKAAAPPVTAQAAAKSQP